MDRTGASHLRAGAGLPLEVAVVWLLVAVVSAEILVTYSRLPARDLYHVSGSGLEGGASRALVFSNFPVALIALAVLALVYERLSTRTRSAVAVVPRVPSARDSLQPPTTRNPPSGKGVSVCPMRPWASAGPAESTFVAGSNHWIDPDV